MKPHSALHLKIENRALRNRPALLVEHGKQTHVVLSADVEGGLTDCAAPAEQAVLRDGERFRFWFHKRSFKSELFDFKDADDWRDYIDHLMADASPTKGDMRS